MKSIIICLLVVSCLAGIRSQAQTFGEFRQLSAAQKTRLVTDSLKRILRLSDPQYSSMYPIVFNAVTRITPILQSDASRADKRQAVRAVVSEEETKMAAVLSASQFSLYKERKQQLTAYYQWHWLDQKVVFTVSP
jgi:hypothetical protein